MGARAFNHPGLGCGLRGLRSIWTSSIALAIRVIGCVIPIVRCGERKGEIRYCYFTHALQYSKLHVKIRVNPQNSCHSRLLAFFLKAFLCALCETSVPFVVRFGCVPTKYAGMRSGP